MNSAALVASSTALLLLADNAELSGWQVLGAVTVGLALGAIVCWWIERW